MSREDQLAELLERWEDTARGADATLRDFFPDAAPDLLDEFRNLLKRMGRLDAVMRGEDAVVNDALVPVGEGARFQPLKFHAQGGLGVVYLAEDRELDRNVALKCMQTLAALDDTARQRFVQEASITGRLEHPGVVPVYGLATDGDGNPYYAMRFIEGTTLGDAIEEYHTADHTDERERNVRFRKLLRHFVSVCETMAYAHSRSVIHRDIKPANIVLGPYGETIVIDWGLAKRIDQTSEGADDSGETVVFSDESPSMTLQGRAMGSPAFMSPEQAEGDWSRVGPASDVYSLGSTLYVLLTGRKPFDGKSATEVVQKVKAGKFPAPREASSAVPQALEAICVKAMSFNPSDRYADAADLAREIERWLADEPVAAWAEPFTVRARRWVKKHRSLVTGAVAALIVGAIGLGTVAAQQSWARSRLDEKNQQLDQTNTELDSTNQTLKDTNGKLVDANKREKAAATEAREQRDEANAQRSLAEANAVLEMIARGQAEDATDAERIARLRAQRLLYQSQIRLAYSEWLANNMRQVEDVLKTCEPQYRGWEWRFLTRLLHTEQEQLDVDYPATCLAQSSNGRVLAAGRRDGRVSVWLQLDKDRRLRVPRDLEFPGNPGGLNLDVTSVSVSPDGRFIAAAAKEPVGLTRKTWVKIWQTAGREIASFSIDCESLAFAPDSKTLAIGVRKFSYRPVGKAKGTVKPAFVSTVQLRDVTTGKTIATVDPQGGTIMSLAFSPDGKSFATGDIGGKVVVFKADTREREFGFTNPGTVKCLAFSADSHRLAVGTSTGSIEIWNLQGLRSKTITTRLARTLRGHDESVTALSFSPDKRYLASASRDRSIKIWSLSDRSERSTIRGHTAGVTGLAYSPDSRTLLSVGEDSRLKQWNALERQEAPQVPGFAAAVSPDGRYLATPHVSLDRKNMTVYLWDVAGGRLVRTVGKLPQHVYDLAFSADGRRLAVCNNKEVVIYSVQTGREFRRIGVEGYASRVAFSPDGNTLAVGVAGSIVENVPGLVQFWNVQDGRRLLSAGIGSGSVNGIEYHPTGKMIAVTELNGGPVRLIDVVTGHTILTLKGHRYHSAGFSREGRRMVTAGGSRSSGGEVRIWDVENGKLLYELPRQSHLVRSATFAPEGDRIVFGSGDGTVRLWDLTMKQEILRLKHARTEDPYINTTAFSRDGSVLVTSSGQYAYGGYTRIWRGTAKK